MRLATFLLFAASAFAQVPEQYTNLQFLPKDISRADLMSRMRGFSFSLGVKCIDCHVGKDSPTLEGVDFASDEKDTKKKAREMLRMVARIQTDDKLLSVRCVTCHHGLQKPQTLQTALSETLEKKDLASALAQYRELREKFYGGAQYDFTETSLNQFAEALMAQRKNKEAAAFMELNGELNKLTRWGVNLTAM